MNELTCSQCNSTDVDSDPSRGHTFCTKCGSVLEENLIVSELQFEEGSHGAANLIGRMVNNDSNYRSVTVGAFASNLTISSRESRELTLENAKLRIKTIGQQLRLNNSYISTAFNFYKMALSRRLTYGRRQNNVYAACLYMTCRLEGTSHMLLDLSDATQVNIFDLGKTYLKLSSALCIRIPPVDPCIYIIRFANSLHKLIGTDMNKVKDIEITALRLVQRMKRDWMHTGRRPSGLCGAALLVACRLNGIHCNIRDIIKIVQVCETTIRKRLFELGETQTGRLTVDEFMTVDLEGEDDPPCFKEARKKEKQIIQSLDASSIEAFEKEIVNFQEMIDRKLENDRAVKHRRFKPICGEAPAIGESEDDIVTEDNVVDRLIENDVASQVMDDNILSQHNSAMQINLRPTAESLGLVPHSSSTFSDSQERDADDDGELHLDGIDEDEIDSYILSKEEQLAREDLWTKVNAEFIEIMEKKEAMEKEAEEERLKKGVDKQHPTKRRRVQRKKAPIVADSASEAIERMLHDRKISSKINYEVLKNLNPQVQRITNDLEDVD